MKLPLVKHQISSTMKQTKQTKQTKPVKNKKILAQHNKATSTDQPSTQDQPHSPSFLERFFDTVSSVTKTIVSWMTNPQNIIENIKNTIQSIFKLVDFFKNLWDKLVNWLSGKNPEETPLKEVTPPMEPLKQSQDSPTHNAAKFSPEKSNVLNQTISQQPELTTTSSMTLIYGKIGKPEPQQASVQVDEEDHVLENQQNKEPTADIVFINTLQESDSIKDVDEPDESHEEVARFGMR